MKRKFECWDCGHTFEADDKDWVKCSHCQSENVEYASFHWPSWIKWAVLAVIAVALIAWGISKIDFHSTQAEEVDPADTVAVEQAVIDSTFVNETGLEIPPSLSIENLEFGEDGYSFNTIIDNPPACKYVVAIIGAFDEKVVATSEDGKFEKIPYSKAEGGSYRLVLRNPANDSTLCEPKVIEGFIKQVKVGKKMSASELQSRIDKRDPSLVGVGENDYLSPDYTLKFKGLSSDAVNIPKVLADVFNKIDMMSWDGVTVTSLEYDDLNRISSITLKVKVSDGF